MSSIQRGAAKSTKARPTPTRPTPTRPTPNRRSGNPDSFSRLLQAHRRVAKSSFKRFFEAPASSLMTTFVIAVSLLLPALLFGLNSNLSSLLAGFQGSTQISLYLHDNVNEGSGFEVSENLLTRADISTAVYLSPQQGLDELAASMGLQNLLQEITPNPLPGAIVVTPADASFEAVNGLVERLQEIPEVALVQVDSRWLQRLTMISRLIKLTGRVLSVIVILGLFFIVGNTIKLAVENHKAEIRVIKLVGGSNMFAARPFLYIGLFYGLAGGILAILLQAIVLYVFKSNFDLLMQLYESEFQLQGFNPGNALFIIISGGTIAWLAALIASLRYIHSIDP